MPWLKAIRDKAKWFSKSQRTKRKNLSSSLPSLVENLKGLTEKEYLKKVDEYAKSLQKDYSYPMSHGIMTLAEKRNAILQMRLVSSLIISSIARNKVANAEELKRIDAFANQVSRKIKELGYNLLKREFTFNGKEIDLARAIGREKLQNLESVIEGIRRNFERQHPLYTTQELHTTHYGLILVQKAIRDCLKAMQK